MTIRAVEPKLLVNSEQLRDIENELRIRARQQAVVAELGQRALRGEGIQELMDDAVKMAAETLDVELSKILELLPGGEEMLIRAGMGWREGAVGSATVGAGLDSQAGYTLVSDNPVVVIDLSKETRFNGPPLLFEHGVVSGISVIIHGRTKPYGVMGVHSTRQRNFSHDDIYFLQSVANTIAGAINRLESENELRLSLNQLEVILQSVADGITVQDPGGKLVYANQAACRILGYESPEELLATPIAKLMERFEMRDEGGQPFPFNKLPGRRALQGELHAEENIRFLVRETGQERWSLAKARPVFSDDGKVRFAVNIFQDVTDLKRSEITQGILAESGKLLAASLDYSERLESLAQLIVPTMADWCSIHVVGEDYKVEKTIVAHVDPEKVRYARDLQKKYPPDFSNDRGVPDVIRTGKSQLYKEIGMDLLTLVAKDDDHLTLLQQLNLKSVMIIPLLARERTLGTISFVWAESDRRYNEEDLEIAEEVARRAALAIENARLYKEAQELNSELEKRVEKRTSQLRSTVSLLKNEVLERKRVEEALRKSEQMLQNFFEAAPDAMVIVDQQGQIVRINHQTEQVFGYTRGELIGSSVDILLPDRFRHSHAKHRTNFSSSPSLRPMGVGIELLGRKKDGQDFPVDIMLNPVEMEDGVLVISAVRDITERKRAEEALRERDALLRAAVTGAPLAMFVVDNEGILKLSMGSAIRNLTQSANVTGKHFSEVFRGDFTIQDHLAEALQGKFINTTLEINQFVYEIQYAPLRDGEGNQTGVISVATDITGRKRAEDALRKSEIRFRTIFEESAVGIGLIDLDGRLVATNQAMQLMVGYSKEELSNLKFLDMTAAEDRGKHRRTLDYILKGKSEHFLSEQRYKRKDGSLAWGRLNLSLVRNDEHEPEFAIAIIEDITVRRQMETELAELQRRLLESAESERLHLAQELHDGPVQDLHGATYQLQSLRDYLVDERGLNEATGIRNVLQNVILNLRQICRELRPPTLTPFGLEKAIRSHAENFMEEHPELKLELDLMQDGQLLPERARLALFRIYQQALANIVRHAQASQVTVRLTLDSERVILEVEDNGRGFEVPTRWIELARQGHLGLVGASERAEAIGGKMNIESAPGKGTHIQVIFPFQN